MYKRLLVACDMSLWALFIGEEAFAFSFVTIEDRTLLDLTILDLAILVLAILVLAILVLTILAKRRTST